MQTQHTLSRKLSSGNALHSIVRTMKAMAAASIWQYEQAVASLSEYNRTVELGLQVLLRSRSRDIIGQPPATDQRLGAVIFGSDHGMCGPFNDHIVNFAIGEMDRLGIEQENRTILAIGSRAIVRLEDQGQQLAGRLSVPSALAGITPRVQDVLRLIEEWRSGLGLRRIILFCNRPGYGVAYQSHALRMLPLDLEWLRDLRRREWPNHVLPTFTMQWDLLFSALVREYIFVSVYRAFAESLSTENAARLASMQTAERNIEERLEELTRQYHLARQNAITEELLDIMSGFEALMSDDTRND